MTIIPQNNSVFIFATGTVGKVRNDNGKDTRVYLSNDGGYTWKVGCLYRGSDLVITPYSAFSILMCQSGLMSMALQTMAIS